jgi:3-deoxy-manno-octulosonate cytidylyltransferase (CMP-KDO synthetase)
VNPLIVIPARMNSARLPGKAMAEIGGRPMILHVYERAVAAGLGPVAVATDSAEIAAVIEAQSGRVALTRRDHACGSDRIGEALETLDPAGAHDVIVNLQGDQPFVSPQAIAAALAPLDDPAVDIGTAATPATAQEAGDPNAVKLVGTPSAERRLRALYFTRATAPWGDGPLWRHVGIYAFRRSALLRFAALPPSPLELRERLEQLRALEAGMRIDATLLDKAAISVDTGRDLEAARQSARRAHIKTDP